MNTADLVKEGWKPDGEKLSRQFDNRADEDKINGITIEYSSIVLEIEFDMGVWWLIIDDHIDEVLLWFPTLEQAATAANAIAAGRWV
jgi:hypothetical protein